MFVVDLHLAEGFTLIALKSVWVDNSFDFLFSFEHHVVSGGEVTLLKGVLGCSMSDEQVLGLSTLIEFQCFLVVLVLFLSLHKSNKGQYLFYSTNLLTNIISFVFGTFS